MAIPIFIPFQWLAKKMHQIVSLNSSGIKIGMVDRNADINDAT
jgi:hypothetical protein